MNGPVPVCGYFRAPPAKHPPTHHQTTRGRGGGSAGGPRPRDRGDSHSSGERCGPQPPSRPNRAVKIKSNGKCQCTAEGHKDTKGPRTQPPPAGQPPDTATHTDHAHTRTPTRAEDGVGEVRYCWGSVYEPNSHLHTRHASRTKSCACTNLREHKLQDMQLKLQLPSMHLTRRAPTQDCTHRSHAMQLYKTT